MGNERIVSKRNDIFFTPIIKTPIFSKKDLIN